MVRCDTACIWSEVQRGSWCARQLSSPRQRDRSEGDPEAGWTRRHSQGQGERPGGVYGPPALPRPLTDPSYASRQLPGRSGDAGAMGVDPADCRSHDAACAPRRRRAGARGGDRRDLSDRCGVLQEMEYVADAVGRRGLGRTVSEQENATTARAARVAASGQCEGISRTSTPTSRWLQGQDAGTLREAAPAPRPVIGSATASDDHRLRSTARASTGGLAARARDRGVASGDQEYRTSGARVRCRG